MMGELLPKAVLPYAKAWIALLGVIASSVVIGWDDAPKWLVVVSSVLTAVGVYLTPNAEEV